MNSIAYVTVEVKLEIKIPKLMNSRSFKGDTEQERINSLVQSIEVDNPDTDIVCDLPELKITKTEICLVRMSNTYMLEHKNEPDKHDILVDVVGSKMNKDGTHDTFSFSLKREKDIKMYQKLIDSSTDCGDGVFSMSAADVESTFSVLMEKDNHFYGE